MELKEYIEKRKEVEEKISELNKSIDALDTTFEAEWGIAQYGLLTFEGLVAFLDKYFETKE